MVYVAYLRVSTAKQGVDGLGMDAQREAIKRFLRPDDQILSEYIEVESGKRKDRPELHKALDHCRITKGTLLVAKLDRLSRNVHFVSSLMEAGIEFVAVDFPQANKLTIHILAAVAEHEREMISTRTKAALAAAKARGVQLGNNNLSPEVAAAGRANAIEVRRGRAREKAIRVLPVISALRGEKKSFRKVAEEMNRGGIVTPRGGRWTAHAVRMAIIRAAP